MGYGLWWLVYLEHGKRLVDRQPLHRHVIMTAQQPACGVNFRGWVEAAEKSTAQYLAVSNYG